MPQERVLVLEDNPDLRSQTCDILVEAGFSVASAASGAEAIAVAQSHPFDLLIADLHIPDMSGIEVFERIRSIHPDVAGVAITGYSNWEVSADALRAGLAGFLVKPVAPEQLVASAVAALEREKLRRENARLRALVPLYELARAFMGTQELTQVLQQVVTMARRETRAEVASLMLIDEDGQQLSIAAADGLSPEIVETEKRTIGKGIAGWVAAHGEALIISEGTLLAPEIQQALGKPEVVSALSLPLRARGDIIGVLNLSRLRGAEPFTQSDLELASVLASQAAVSIDKARLIDVLSTLSETSQSLASALDLDEAATIILEAATRVAQAPRAVLWLVEDVSNQLTLYKTFGFQPDERQRLIPPPFLAPPEPFNVRDRKGILSLPIIRVDKKFGLIELYLAGSERPRADRIGVLRTLAHTAAAVIESYRLRAREVIAFREMDMALRSDLNLQQVLERVLNQMIEACGAQGGAIFITDADQNQLDTWVRSGLSAPTELAQRIIQDNQPLIQSSTANKGMGGIGSVIGTPLTVGARVEGAVVLTHREPRAFAPRHLNLLSVLSSSAALIVRNAQLYARSEEAAITEERARMAREIHDGLAQDLAFLILKVQVLQEQLRKGKMVQLEKELEELTTALRRDVGEVRRTIFALRPLDLETLGFLPALEKFIGEFANSNDIQVHLERLGSLGNLSTKLQSALFRLIQESLNNIRKHARATNAWIQLEVDDRWAKLTVRDDGRGFDPEQALQAARQRGSVGMIQMRERAERAGGSFDLDTAPGKGTRIDVKLPVKLTSQ